MKDTMCNGKISQLTRNKFDFFAHFYLFTFCVCPLYYTVETTIKDYKYAALPERGILHLTKQLDCAFFWCVLAKPSIDPRFRGVYHYLAIRVSACAV